MASRTSTALGEHRIGDTLAILGGEPVLANALPRRRSIGRPELDAEAGAGASRSLMNDGLRSRVPHALRELRGGPRLPWLHPDFVSSVETRPPERPSDLRGSLP